MSPAEREALRALTHAMMLLLADAVSNGSSYGSEAVKAMAALAKAQGTLEAQDRTP
jgi:hypothetical protein